MKQQDLDIDGNKIKIHLFVLFYFCDNIVLSGINKILLYQSLRVTPFGHFFKKQKWNFFCSFS
jgi:hypothetical protein